MFTEQQYLEQDEQVLPQGQQHSPRNDAKESTLRTAVKLLDPQELFTPGLTDLRLAGKREMPSVAEAHLKFAESLHPFLSEVPEHFRQEIGKTRGPEAFDMTSSTRRMMHPDLPSARLVNHIPAELLMQ